MRRPGDHPGAGAPAGGDVRGNGSRRPPAVTDESDWPRPEAVMTVITVMYEDIARGSDGLGTPPIPGDGSALSRPRRRISSRNLADCTLGSVLAQ
jgi:hypothetical protein